VRDVVPGVRVEREDPQRAWPRRVGDVDEADGAADGVGVDEGIAVGGGGDDFRDGLRGGGGAVVQIVAEGGNPLEALRLDRLTVTGRSSQKPK
jgi:hypothetical protein